MIIRFIKKCRAAVLALIIALLPVLTYAQAEAYLYGTLTMENEDTYTGALRWGNEEVFWTDFFNSTKIRNENLKYLSRDDTRELKKNKQWISRWLDIYIEESDLMNSFNHSFECMFGELASLTILRDDEVEIVFRDGSAMILDGGSNDIGASIQVIDSEVGLIKLDWDRIERIDFMEAPANTKDLFGEALWAEVETLGGEFVGLLQWDHDERLASDKLDGDSKHGDVSINFGNINSIARDGRGSLVVLKSGREMFLDGSNDVNSSNRGIIVTVPGMGRVDISWEEFRKLSFVDMPENALMKYSDFVEPKQLRGVVYDIYNEEWAGAIVFDLDEKLDLEILHGSDDGLDYFIPFRNIKKITPRNFRYSLVELMDGKEVLIGYSHDVSDENDGVLIFTGNDEPEYIPWEKVKEIEFKL